MSAPLFMRCPRPTCDKGRVYDTVDGVRQGPGYTCSVCGGKRFVPAPAQSPSERDRYDLVKTLTALEVVLVLARERADQLTIPRFLATANDAIATVEAHRDALMESLR